MQNLILDFGNTLYKGGIFDHGNLIHKFSGRHLQQTDLFTLKENFPKLERAIYSTVIDLDKDLEKHLLSNFESIKLNHRTPIPIQNLYHHPESLGNDRLAAAIGGALLYPNKNILIIDAGSSITYEMVTKEGHYLGGGISPGIAMRFKSLHQNTDKLPLISSTASNKNKLVGQTTEEAILSGVLNGVLAEVDGIIDQYKNIHPEIFVLITGGDLKHFDKNLKNNIFAAENLVLQGLNFILEYNDNKTA